MKYLVAAAAAFSVFGASAAMAQPYGNSGQQGYYNQPSYGQQQPYRGQAYDNRSYGGAAPYGYAQPYAGNGYAYGGSAYNGGNYGARAYGYNNRNDRHVRRDNRRDRHYVAPRARYDRHY